MPPPPNATQRLPTNLDPARSAHKKFVNIGKPTPVVRRGSSPKKPPPLNSIDSRLIRKGETQRHGLHNPRISYSKFCDSHRSCCTVSIAVKHYYSSMYDGIGGICTIDTYSCDTGKKKTK